MLRYSDRSRLAEHGSLGPFSEASVPGGMANAVLSIVQHLPSHVDRAVAREVVQHLGLADDPRPWFYWLRDRTVMEFLDFLEILSVEVQRVYRNLGAAVPDIVYRLNRLAYRHRFGYQIDAQNRVRRIGSPALDQYVTGPALQAVHRPGWEEVERSYREAIAHQRGGPAERDDALTAATAALEAALKAAGLKGNRLTDLAKSLRNSDLVPGQLRGVPEALDVLLKRSSAIRDPMSDAHGKAPGADEVPQEIVDLSIYWTGAFINYLAAVAE
jgi:hypothetical protein